jgi:hypothetical protein
LNDKDIAARVGLIGPVVDGSMGVPAVAAFLASETARWRDIVKEIGVLPE